MVQAHKIYSHLILAVLAFGVSACQPEFATNIPDQENHGRAVSAIHVISDTKVVDFGWLPDGKVFYGVGDPYSHDRYPLSKPDKTTWYEYDPLSQKTAEIESPFLKISSGIFKALTPDIQKQILTITISPDGTKAIYTRLPRGYTQPTTTQPHYINPAELWVYDGQNHIPILDQPDEFYDCSDGLSSESNWFENDTLVLGSCLSTYGITRIYFLLDSLEGNIEFLNFKTPDGQDLPTEQISVAHHSPSLVFLGGGFWMKRVLQGQRNIPTTLETKDLLVNDYPVVSPVWSPDDQWIYYWTLGKSSTTGQDDFRPWWLEKINIATKERQMVLSEDQLRSFMDDDMYRLGQPIGFGNPWQLSSDGKQLLLFMSETYKSPATLFLVQLSRSQ